MFIRSFLLQTNESLSMLNRMIQNNYAVFSDETNDTYNLQNYVEKNGYVFVRDRPAINIMLYRDYLYRKTVSFSDEKVHCPFAMAKEPFLKKKRTFAYPIGSNLSPKFTLPYNTVNDILTKNKHFVSMRGGGVEYAIRTVSGIPWESDELKGMGRP